MCGKKSQRPQSAVGQVALDTHRHQTNPKHKQAEPPTRDTADSAPQDPEIEAWPKIGQPQGQSAGLSEGRSTDAESENTPAMERYLQERDDLALDATRKRDSGMRRFLDHWQQKWNAIKDDKSH